MTYTTILRGFKAPYPVVDAFLHANGAEMTYGRPRLERDDTQISSVLRAKMGVDGIDAAVIVPQREGFSESSMVYVAYSWARVFAQREIDMNSNLIKGDAPHEFEKLRMEILSYAERFDNIKITEDVGTIGLFVVFTYGRDWSPPELTTRYYEDVDCQECGSRFENFEKKQIHRRNIHGAWEGIYPPPDV